MDCSCPLRSLLVLVLFIVVAVVMVMVIVNCFEFHSVQRNPLFSPLTSLAIRHFTQTDRFPRPSFSRSLESQHAIRQVIRLS